jgi:hypothetical protein
LLTSDPPVETNLYESGLLWVGLGGRGLKVAAELPYRLKEFRVRGLPQAAAVEIGTQLPDGGQKLTGAHLGDNIRQISEGGE